MGTCSWKYPSWDKLVYSSAKPENYLQEYARKYNSVEIDQWFWSLFGVDTLVLPKADVVKTYAASVPQDFRFVIKAPNSITLSHIYPQYTGGKLTENTHFLSPDLYDQFLFSIHELLPNVGAISLQFEYLNRQKMPDPAHFMEKLLNFIDKVDTTVPLCIELRNPNYLNRKYFQFLQEHHIGHTFCQGYFMPDIRNIFDAHAPFFSGTQIIRLLGSDRQGIERTTGDRWDRIVAPRDDEIKGIAALIRRMVDQSGIDLYLNVNNHYEGSAPITIERMLEYL